MSGKSTALYKEVFAFIEEKVFKLMPSAFMTDFEAGLRKAICEHWPGIPLHGCWYHFCAAVRRKLRILHILQLIADDYSAKMIYRELLSLPLLPTQYIENGYMLIKENARANNVFKEFRKFFKYFDEFWLNLVCSYII